MNNIRILIILFSSFLISACASTPMDYKAIENNNISTVTLVSGTKLKAEPSSSGSDGAMIVGGGLLGSLIGTSIDAAINSKRQSQISPISDVIDNVNLRELFTNELKTLNGAVFSQSLDVRSNAKALSKQDLADYSLNINANYYLSVNHQSVLVNANVQLITKSDSSPHTTSFIGKDSVDLGGTEVNIEDVTEFWIDNPEELEKTIVNAIKDVTQKIQTYFNKQPET